MEDTCLASLNVSRCKPLVSVLCFALAAYLIQCLTALTVCMSSFYVLPVESNGPCAFCLTI